MNFIAYIRSNCKQGVKKSETFADVINGSPLSLREGEGRNDGRKEMGMECPAELTVDRRYFLRGRQEYD